MKLQEKKNVFDGVPFKLAFLTNKVRNKERNE